MNVSEHFKQLFRLMTHDGQKRAGWIFQKAKEAQVPEAIGMTE